MVISKGIKLFLYRKNISIFSSSFYFARMYAQNLGTILKLLHKDSNSVQKVPNCFWIRQNHVGPFLFTFYKYSESFCNFSRSKFMLEASTGNTKKYQIVFVLGKYYYTFFFIAWLFGLLEAMSSNKLKHFVKINIDKPSQPSADNIWFFFGVRKVC